MIPHVDWLTYNATTGINIGSGVPSNFYPKSEAARDAVSVFPPSFLLRLDYEIVSPRRPHEWALQCINTSLRISGRYSSPRVHVEVPGKACDLLSKSGHLTSIAVERAPLLSRLDIAVDILTPTKPDVVAKTFTNRNFKTRSSMTSPKGHTEYVGAWASDRFARVYRYNPPTPRWKYLRFEFVFKRKHAQIVAFRLGVGGWPGLLSSIGDLYGIQHPLWVSGVETIPGSSADIAWVRDRKASKTLHWLESTCMPSVVRLIREGEIENIDDWLRTHVYDKITIALD